MTEDRNGITPSRAEAEVATAPTLSAAEEIAELRAEVERLRRQLLKQASEDESASDADWPRTITYAEQPFSGARLGGITQHRDKIRPTTDFDELPKPTRDVEQLEADFVRWGYCLVADALSAAQTQAQIDRLLDQAAAERAAGIAHTSHRDAAQTVFNLLPKGQVFRDLIAFEPGAADGGPQVEALVAKILGDGYFLGTAHGSIVHQHGGRQELHQDQGHVPLPHPPFPLYCLLIWCYSDFSLENGGTYIVPGSHRDSSGASSVRPEVAFESLADGRLMALTVPAGTCVLTDSRVLHSGGKRSAPGTRLASRILYGRGMMRQQENQLACISDEMLESLSPKLHGLIGFKPYYGWGMVDGNTIDPAKPKVPIGEMSMTRPEEFSADFDWRYSRNAKALAKREWDSDTQYRGDD